MLKALLGCGLLAALLSTPPKADADDTLITGSIRDQAGAPVTGANVAAFDTAGRPVGNNVVSGDGTFALDASEPVSTVEVTCAYCASVTRHVDRPADALIIIVKRFTAVVQTGPSLADIRALPYRSATDIASLRPFSVVADSQISDRGLDVFGSTLINGLPFYSPLDGDNYSRLLPAHAVASVSSASPLGAPIYGGYASAGLYNFALHDLDVQTSRLDAGDSFDSVVRGNSRDVDGMFADSNDGGVRRVATSTSIDLPFVGGRLGFTALQMADNTSDASGAGLHYRTMSRRFSSEAGVTATRSGDASFVTFNANIRNTGPLGLEFGLRGTRATTTMTGNASMQSDTAMYADATHTSGAFNLAVDLAFDRGSDSGNAGNARAGALIGSLSGDLALGSRWTAHSGAVSNLRIPTFVETLAAMPSGAPGDRSLLFEQSLSYADLRRLRVSAIAYTQRSTSVETGHINGVGVSTAWQISPEFSVRTWLLRAKASAIFPAAEASPSQTFATPISGNLIWLTYEHGLRVDALMHTGALEGDMRIPIGRSAAVALGSARYNGQRVTTIGLTVR